MSESVHTPLEVAQGILSGKYTITSIFMLVNQIADARAEVERLRAERDTLAALDAAAAKTDKEGGR